MHREPQQGCANTHTHRFWSGIVYPQQTVFRVRLPVKSSHSTTWKKEPDLNRIRKIRFAWIVACHAARQKSMLISPDKQKSNWATYSPGLAMLSSPSSSCHAATECRGKHLRCCRLASRIAAIPAAKPHLEHYQWRASSLVSSSFSLSVSRATALHNAYYPWLTELRLIYPRSTMIVEGASSFSAHNDRCSVLSYARSTLVLRTC